MNRIRVLRIIYLTVLGLVIIRLFYWQVLRFDDLSARAENQHLDFRTIEAPRGAIWTSDGAILAANKPTYLLFATPKVIKDKARTAEELAKVLVVSSHLGTEPIEPMEIIKKKAEIQQKLESDYYWVQIARNIEHNVKTKIELLGITGIGFEGSSSRFYPEASSSSHLLGFVGSDPVGRAVGYFGLEGMYNRQLKGISGELTQEKDAMGLPILSGKFLERQAVEGYSLVLNIDRTVQYLVEKKLKEGVSKFGAKSATVIVMDVATGGIIAMASYPNYDPGKFATFPKEYYKNPAVAESYEPGSTFKVLVMAAALNEEAVKSDEVCDNCEGPVEISGHVIRTWNNKYKQGLTMSEAIIHSDNTGMVYAGKKLGMDKLYKYIQSFGFGERTGIDLQDEESPDLRPKSEWREIDLATATFGQGIAATPIQMVRAIAAIANGGKLMQPQIVSSVVLGEKRTNIYPRVVGQPIKEETARQITAMMVSAVEQGEARIYKKRAGLERYQIAGKTGTAQIPVQGHYDPNKTVASFVGFAPADNPKFVMMVKYNEPSSSIFGAETAAPTFFEIAKELFLYYNILPAN